MSPSPTLPVTDCRTTEQNAKWLVLLLFISCFYCKCQKVFGNMCMFVARSRLIIVKLSKLCLHRSLMSSSLSLFKVHVFIFLWKPNHVSTCLLCMESASFHAFRNWLEHWIGNRRQLFETPCKQIRLDAIFKTNKKEKNVIWVSMRSICSLCIVEIYGLIPGKDWQKVSRMCLSLNDMTKCLR